MIQIRGIRSSQRSSAGRAVKKARIEPQVVDTNRIARCQLDTRADTICAGANCRPIYFTRKQCEVKGFSDEFEPIHDVRVASVATAWCDGMGGPTYI